MSSIGFEPTTSAIHVDLYIYTYILVAEPLESILILKIFSLPNYISITIDFTEATSQKPLIGFNHPAMLPDGHILVGSEVYKCVPLRNGSRLCRPETVGCFDMGGSSMQIAFEFQSDQPVRSLNCFLFFATRHT